MSTVAETPSAVAKTHSVQEPALKVEHLTVEFTSKKKKATVLDDVSFEVNRGETLCLVGESGCGKSMTALAIMGLIPDLGKRREGSITLLGQDLTQLNADRKSTRLNSSHVR